MMSFDEFWCKLRDKGYNYGFDAADNAYMGYKFALELQEQKKVGPMVEGIIKGVADLYDIPGLHMLAEEIRSLVRDK